MTLQQLKDKVEEIGLAVPAKANRGILMRMIRDNGGKGGETLLSFGRYKGLRFVDTPVGYRTWAVREVYNNTNASEDLRMFAAWWTAETEERGVVHPTPYHDPETDASIPYIPEDSSSLEWDRVSSRPKSAAYPSTAARTQPKRRSAPSEASSTSRMDQEIPEDILDEVQHLEHRLAILRDRHGIPPRAAHQDPPN